MNRYLKQVILGVLVWVIPFAISVIIFPLHESMLMFFKTLMIIIGAISGVFFIVIYFSKEKINYFSDGISLGIIWFVINITLDLVVLVVLFKTPVVEYFTDTGLRYLIMPVITFGFGYILSKNK